MSDKEISETTAGQSPVCTCPGACEEGMGSFGTFLLTLGAVGFFVLISPFFWVALVEWLR